MSAVDVDGKPGFRELYRRIHVPDKGTCTLLYVEFALLICRKEFGKIDGEY